jgi:UDP-N-acetylglucosamine transferase subunit ALG13
MIFVTVGTQLPFDRMVRTVDRWADGHSYGDVFAQIGPAKYHPKCFPWSEFLDADECRRKIEQADLVVAHAGMGSILTALELGKPIVVMPRLAAFGEHRNDHQLATAKRLLTQGRIIVAFDECQLLEKLTYFKTLRPADRIQVHASSTLLETIRAFVEGRSPFHSSVAVPQEEKVNAIRARRNRLNEPIDLVHSSGGSPIQNQQNRKYSAAHIKSRLSSMLLLAGRLRPMDLSRRSGRSRLDLPIDLDHTLLSYWRDEALRLSRAWGIDELPLRVLLDQASPMPTLPPPVPGISISIERDKAKFRGTGGVLRDACANYDDDDWSLVANAAQLLFGSLRGIADRLADCQSGGGGEINVVQDHDGIPNGVILLRCGVLRSIPEIGFHDMKEQVIPSLARHHRVRVVSTQGLTSRPIHSLNDFIDAIGTYYARHSSGSIMHDTETGEHWQSHFVIRERGALVAPTAIVHDAVILQGAVVEEGAVIVRSVIGQGVRVRSGQKIIDQVVV